MVVVTINEHGIFPFEGKSEPPVAAYGHRPVAFQFPMERMQPPAGGVHVLRGSGIVQRKELLAQPLCMSSLDFGFRPCSEEQLDAFVAKAPDHTYSV